MANKLATTRYVPPGTYIGQIITPSGATPPDNTRLPVFIGKGSRLASGSNLAIRRSYIYEEELSFSNSSPYTAMLHHNASNDQTLARLYKSDGVEVLNSNWSFQKDEITSKYNAVIINPDVFDASAKYMIDYQSVDSDVLDPIPVKELREITAVGSAVDTAQYKEYVNYYVPCTLTSPSKEGTASEATIGTLYKKDDTPTTSAALVFAGTPTSEYSKVIVFKYVGNDQYDWWTVNESLGNNATVPMTSKATVTVSSTAATLIDGITVTKGTDAPTENDVFYVNVIAPSKIELDPRYNNLTDNIQYGTITEAIGGNGTFIYDASTNYSLKTNVKVKVECVIRGAIDTAKFAFAVAGGVNIRSSEDSSDHLSVPAGVDTVNGVLTIPGTGLKLKATSKDTNAAAFEVGDKFEFEVKAPRIFNKIKDNRTYTFTVSSKNEGTTLFGYSSSTVEGGFGSVTAKYNGVNDFGLMELPNSLYLYERNVFSLATAAADTFNTFEPEDKWTLSSLCSEHICWDLTEEKSETFNLASCPVDTLGAITGIAGCKYLILSKTPLSVNSVKNPDTGDALSYTWVNNSAYIALPAVASTVNKVTVEYTWSAAEPVPGQTYYFSANYLRPDDMYNKPIYLSSSAIAKTTLAPASKDNHLYIMTDIAFSNNVPGCYVVQVKDADSDGVFTNLDFKNAIAASENSSRITDLVVLDNFGSLSDELTSIAKCNDPFEKKERLLWLGAPIGTKIGSVEEEDSLVYLSKVTLQVYGDDPAHGTRILVGSTKAVYTLGLPGGTEIDVTLDGSFVAGALASLNASFDLPATSILRKTLSGFKSIEVYDEDSAENNTLGGANIVYLTNRGNNVYRVEEDITTDTFAEDFNLINNMCQKQWMTKYVRSVVDSKVIAMPVASPSVGIILVRSAIADACSYAAANGFVGQYQTDSGATRALDISSDIQVYKDTDDSTKYHMLYAFYLQNTIKRVFGMYTVNTNNFGSLA